MTDVCETGSPLRPEQCDAVDSGHRASNDEEYSGILGDLPIDPECTIKYCGEMFGSRQWKWTNEKDLGIARSVRSGRRGSSIKSIVLNTEQQRLTPYLSHHVHIPSIITYLHDTAARPHPPRHPSSLTLLQSLPPTLDPPATSRTQNSRAPKEPLPFLHCSYEQAPTLSPIPRPAACSAARGTATRACRRYSVTSGHSTLQGIHILPVGYRIALLLLASIPGMQWSMDELLQTHLRLP